MKFVSLQLNAVSITCCSAGTVWFFPEATEVIKMIVQALFIVGCSYLIMGKEQGLKWAQVRGYRVLKGVYLHFLVLSAIALLQDLIPYAYFLKPAPLELWVSNTNPNSVSWEDFHCQVCWLVSFPAHQQ